MAPPDDDDDDDDEPAPDESRAFEETTDGHVRAPTSWICPNDECRATNPGARTICDQCGTAKD